MYTEYTPTACMTVHTVCSKARTNVNACLWLKSRWLSCIIFVHLKESIFRSAMSHHCWSFPHLLTRATFSKTTLYTDKPLPQEPLQPLPEELSHEPLPANAIRSENNAKESLSDPDFESAGNLRINTPTGYEPTEFTTEEIATHPLMSPEEGIYQLYGVLVMEETRGFGQIQVQSVLDQEMAKMSTH